MRFKVKKVFLVGITHFLIQISTTLAQAQECTQQSLKFSDTIGMKVEKVGSIPALNTDAFSYNMNVMDNFYADHIYFLDQNNGKIYSYNGPTSETKLIFDVKSSVIPAGLTLDWTFDSPGFTNRVKSMTQGTSNNEVIVVFTSSTLPAGWTKADSTLPPVGAYGQWVCNPNSIDGMVWIPDIYRTDVLPKCMDTGGGLQTFTAYDVFYKYKLVNGELTNPDPFFASESAILPGHLGGAIATVDEESVLWATGDCSFWGIDGSYVPQLNHESCGKILLIDAKSKGEFRIVAKGVRNSQQMRIFQKAKDKKKRFLAFMDIGGVTAEEVNAVALKKILNPNTIENFGWGRNIYDGKSREGTFYVNPGIGGVLSTQPSCAGNAPIGEPGYRQPWIQFGRSATDFFYAISSFAVPFSGNHKLRLLWSEMNTGKLMGAESMVFKHSTPPSTGFKIKLYNSTTAPDSTERFFIAMENGPQKKSCSWVARSKTELRCQKFPEAKENCPNTCIYDNYLENGFNDLVREELGDLGNYRGDPRLFHYPDGQAGVFIERTGVFYKLTEIELSP